MCFSVDDRLTDWLVNGGKERKKDSSGYQCTYSTKGKKEKNEGEKSVVYVYQMYISKDDVIHPLNPPMYTANFKVVCMQKTMI